MSLSKESIDKFKEIYKQQFGKEISDEKAYEGANSLVNLVDTLIKLNAKELQRKDRLKKEPGGFTLDDGEYSCSICHQQQPEGQIWYDKWGVTCATCRKAVQTGAVPSFVCENRNSWYPMWQLENKFGIKHPTARKLVREGKIKARIVPAENGNPYEYVFLKKDNPELVDPDVRNPIRKSYDRHESKIYKIKVREETKKLKKKWEAEKKKTRELLRKHRG